MKIISSGLAQHLAGEVTTLATCWQITRRDGAVLGFTDHVRDLEVEGVTYRASSGYTRTAIRGTADLAVDNLDVGELTWTGGANAGQTVAVRGWVAATSTLSLFLPALYEIQAGDAFVIRPGCDKSFATCKAKFDNAANFRGFPHVPGTDQVLSYPDAQS